MLSPAVGKLAHEIQLERRRGNGLPHREPGHVPRVAVEPDPDGRRVHVVHADLAGPEVLLGSTARVEAARVSGTARPGRIGRGASSCARYLLFPRASTCPRISPPGKSPGPVFTGATPSLVCAFTYAPPVSSRVSRSDMGCPAKEPTKFAAVIVPSAMTPCVRPPPSGAVTFGVVEG